MRVSPGFRRAGRHFSLRRYRLVAGDGHYLESARSRYAHVYHRIRGSSLRRVAMGEGGRGASLAANIIGLRSRGNFDKSEDRVRKLTEALLRRDSAGVFELAVSHTTPNQVQQLLGTRSVSRPSLSTSSASLEEAMMSWDFHHYLPSDILVKVDRMTMRVGLEGREPLLDHRLAEFA